MPPVVSTAGVWRPASAAARPAIAGPRPRRVAPCMRAVNMGLCIGGSLSPLSVQDEADIAAIAVVTRRIVLAGHAVEAVEAAEQLAGGVRGVGIAFVGSRQILLRDRAH